MYPPLDEGLRYNGAAPHPERWRNSMAEMKEFAGIYYREGALDPKTMQLVALAAMAAGGCTS
jgi:alkylhydroperoxidase/carboxymuconolactone decarboxylase family protein YurZ